MAVGFKVTSSVPVASSLGLEMSRKLSISCKVTALSASAVVSGPMMMTLILFRSTIPPLNPRMYSGTTVSSNCIKERITHDIKQKVHGMLLRGEDS